MGGGRGWRLSISNVPQHVEFYAPRNYYSSAISVRRNKSLEMRIKLAEIHTTDEFIRL